MRILVVTPQPYGLAAGSGGGRLCFQLLQYLARAHDLVLVCFAKPGADQAGLLDELKRLCRSVHSVPAPAGLLQALRCKLNLYLKGVPARVTLHSAARMRRTLAEVIARERPDVALVQFPWMAQYVDLLGDVPAIMDVQDSFSVSQYRAACAQRGRLRRLHAYVSWLAWVRHEKRFYARFKSVVVLTEQDRMALALYEPSLRAHVNPPAISLPAPPPARRRSPGRLAFVADLSRAANVSGLEYFLQHVFPLICAEQPDVELLVAGKGAPPRLQRHASAKVRFVGFVADLSAFLSEAAVVVVPLTWGGGIKVKTLEALACRAPVVSTSIGAEETGAVDGVHLLIRDRPREFAQAVVHLLRNPAAAERLAAAGERLVRTRFAPDERWRAFEQVVEDVALEPLQAGVREDGAARGATSPAPFARRPAAGIDASR